MTMNEDEQNQETTEQQKYEFTGETKPFFGRTLYRIRNLYTNELGEWIESEENLSQEGECWIPLSVMLPECTRMQE